MQWHEFKEKAYNGIYKARWYPRIYLPNCQPVVVYTISKTGSTTLRFTLYRNGVGPVFWTHSMNRVSFSPFSQQHHLQDIKLKYRRWWRDQFWSDQFWINHILEHYIKQDRPIKIVTSVRDWVARDISRFFERFKRWNKVSVNHYAGRFDELQEIFFAEIREYDVNLTSWFEHEFQDVLGVNIYDQPFPHEQGYQILRHNQIEILLLRIETPDNIKEKALSEFLNTPNIKMYRTNIGAEKDYKDTYRDFKQFLKLPQDYIDSSYESSDMKHFYTADEIAQFRSKWAVL
jgi:hypothetical protein